MSGRALNAISVIYTPPPCLGIDVEILQVVIEVNGAGAEVSSEQRRVRCEDGCYIQLSLLGQRQGDTSQPLVEMRDDSFLFLVRYKLGK